MSLAGPHNSRTMLDSSCQRARSHKGRNRPSRSSLLGQRATGSPPEGWLHDPPGWTPCPRWPGASARYHAHLSKRYPPSGSHTYRGRRKAKGKRRKHLTPPRKKPSSSKRKRASGERTLHKSCSSTLFKPSSFPLPLVLWPLPSDRITTALSQPLESAPLPLAGSLRAE